MPVCGFFQLRQSLALRVGWQSASRRYVDGIRFVGAAPQWYGAHSRRPFRGDLDLDLILRIRDFGLCWPSHRTAGELPAQRLVLRLHDRQIESRRLGAVNYGGRD